MNLSEYLSRLVILVPFTLLLVGGGSYLVYEGQRYLRKKEGHKIYVNGDECEVPLDSPINRDIGINSIMLGVFCFLFFIIVISNLYFKSNMFRPLITIVSLLGLYVYGSRNRLEEKIKKEKLYLDQQDYPDNE